MKTAYEITSAPKFASQQEFDCDFCEFHSLKRPVFLTDGSRTYSAGAGCAAKALYGDDRPTYVKRVKEEFDLVSFHAAQREEIRAELVARAAKAIADFHANKHSVELQSLRVAFHHADAWENFIDYLVHVARTGEIN